MSCEFRIKPIISLPKSHPKSHPKKRLIHGQAGCRHLRIRQAGKGRDRLLGDGDGLFLRICPQGTKTWLIEYEFGSKRRKYTIGAYSREGAPGESLPEWLRHGRLSLSQARAIAGNWKDARRAGHDPVAEWEAQLAREREAEAAKKAAEEAETSRLTVRQAIDTFMARHMAGKKSAPAIRYRLDRLADYVGERKIGDVTRCVVHDFRRTLISRLPDLGFEPFIGHKIANHVLPGLLAHYNHNGYEAQRKAALEAWASRIEALANALP